MEGKNRNMSVSASRHFAPLHFTQHTYIQYLPTGLSPYLLDLALLLLFFASASTSKTSSSQMSCMNLSIRLLNIYSSHLNQLSPIEILIRWRSIFSSRSRKLTEHSIALLLQYVYPICNVWPIEISKKKYPQKYALRWLLWKKSFTDRRAAYMYYIYYIYKYIYM